MNKLISQRSRLSKSDISYTLSYLAAPLQPVAHSLQITAYAQAADWFLDSVHEVARLANLPRGWDTHDSPSVTAEARDQTVRLLMKVARGPLFQPHIGAVPGGGLQMEWNVNAKSLELEVLPNGSVQFLKTCDDTTIVEGLVQSDDADMVREHVSWVAA